MFTGLFDEEKDEISFEKLGRKSVMHVIKDVFGDQPGRPKLVLTPEAPQPVAVMEAKEKPRRKPATPLEGRQGQGFSFLRMGRCALRRVQPDSIVNLPSLLVPLSLLQSAGHLEHGLSDFDVSQRFTVSNIIVLQSGTPFTVYTSAPFNPILDGSGERNRTETRER